MGFKLRVQTSAFFDLLFSQIEKSSMRARSFLGVQSPDFLLKRTPFHPGEGDGEGGRRAAVRQIGENEVATVCADGFGGRI